MTWTPNCSRYARRPKSSPYLLGTFLSPAIPTYSTCTWCSTLWFLRTPSSYLVPNLPFCILHIYERCNANTLSRKTMTDAKTREPVLGGMGSILRVASTYDVSSLTLPIMLAVGGGGEIEKLPKADDCRLYVTALLQYMRRFLVEHSEQKDHSLRTFQFLCGKGNVLFQHYCKVGTFFLPRTSPAYTKTVELSY